MRTGNKRRYRIFSIGILVALVDFMWKWLALAYIVAVLVLSAKARADQVSQSDLDLVLNTKVDGVSA